jgi:FlaA1/EpsC-like NDP-sugar epimerase
VFSVPQNIVPVMSFAIMIAVIAIGLRLVFDFERIPNLVPIESVRNKYFDYIIIGAGTAGSVLSYKLTKHSNYTVLLIEAGGVFNGLSIVPILRYINANERVIKSLKYYLIYI